MANRSNSQLTAASALTGAEAVAISVPSSTVTITAATISAVAADNSYNDSGNGFLAAGFAVGNRVRVTGFTGTVANNIYSGVVTSLTASKMIIGGTDGDVITDDAAGESVTITKWESRRTTVSDFSTVLDGDKGDITVTLSGSTWTIDNGVVSNAKLATMAQATFKGRAAGAGTGTATDLTGAQAGAILAGVNIDWTTTQYFSVTSAQVSGVTGLADGSSAMFVNESIQLVRAGSEGFIFFMRIPGSYASPTAIQSGDSLGEFDFGGYDGTTTRKQSVRVFAAASETWTATNRGSNFRVITTTAGGSTTATRMLLGGDATGGFADFPNGADAQAGIGFLSDADTGFLNPSANVLGITTGGTRRVTIDSNAVVATVPVQGPAGSASAPALSTSGDTNTGIHFPSADEMDFVTGGVLRMTLDSGGRVLMGPSASSQVVGALGALSTQINGTSSLGLSIARWSNNTTGAVFVMGKSRGTAVGALGAAASGDFIARWQFVADDGTDMTTVGAQIQVSIDNTVSTDVVPCRIEFTTATAAGALSEKMRIASAAQVQFVAGSATTPGISWLTDIDSGIYSLGADNFGFSTGGTLRWDINTTRILSTLQHQGADGTVGAPTWSFSNDADCGWYRIGANNLGLAVNGAKVLDVATTGITVTGNVTLGTAGNGLLVKEGTNATMGVATLVAGTVTVNTTKVTANSRIFLTHQNNSGVVGSPSVSARSAGTSFTITSTSATDTSQVAWMIVEPA